MLDYMTDNKLIDKSVQKGFMKKMLGCVEHTQALYTKLAELKEAKTMRRQIHAVWIDLMNAYGKALLCVPCTGITSVNPLLTW